MNQKHYVNLARLRALEFGQSQILSQSNPSPSDPLSSVPSSNKSTTASLLVTSQPLPSPSSSKPYVDPPRGLFADQFENLANLAAHEEGTGPEIYRQTSGNVDGFISGAGTGGTIAGVGKYLKSMNESIEIVLADCEGSGLFHKVKDGVMYSSSEEEGKRRRYQTDTVVEGIGLNRLTRNFSEALPFIDDAFRLVVFTFFDMCRI